MCENEKILFIKGCHYPKLMSLLNWIILFGSLGSCYSSVGVPTLNGVKARENISKGVPKDHFQKIFQYE
jgi:hypothetical protein